MLLILKKKKKTEWALIASSDGAAYYQTNSSRNHWIKHVRRQLSEDNGELYKVSQPQ